MTRPRFLCLLPWACLAGCAAFGPATYADRPESFKVEPQQSTKIDPAAMKIPVRAVVIGSRLHQALGEAQIFKEVVLCDRFTDVAKQRGDVTFEVVLTGLPRSKHREIVTSDAVCTLAIDGENYSVTQGVKVTIEGFYFRENFPPDVRLRCQEAATRPLVAKLSQDGNGVWSLVTRSPERAIVCANDAERRGYESLRAGDSQGATRSFNLQYRIATQTDWKDWHMTNEKKTPCAKHFTSWAYYNLACAAAKSEALDLAITNLGKAVDIGFLDVAGAEHIANDPDLAPLREDPRFRALLARRAGGADSPSPKKVAEVQ